MNGYALLRRIASARRALGVLVLLTTCLMGWAAPASAYTTSTSGRPGAATLYRVQGGHYNACSGQIYSCYNPDVFVPAPYVTRSPATTGTQTVAIVTTLFTWTGSSWSQSAQQSGAKVLPAGQSGMPLLTSEFKINRAGSFKTQTFLHWYDASGNALGWRLSNFVQSGDYTCVGRFTASCNATQGYVTLRSPGV